MVLDGPAIGAGWSASCVGAYSACVLSVMAACALASVAFGLHCFCGYSGCVLLNTRSTSFSLFSFSLKHWTLHFWDRERPDGHHRGIEYLRSSNLLSTLSLLATTTSSPLVDSPKVSDPSLLALIMTYVVPTLITSPLVILAIFLEPEADDSSTKKLGVFSLCPCRFSRPLWLMTPTFLVHLGLGLRLRSAQSVNTEVWCAPNMVVVSSCRDIVHVCSPHLVSHICSWSWLWIWD
jgi:hypothetical protein